MDQKLFFLTYDFVHRINNKNKKQKNKEEKNINNNT